MTDMPMMPSPASGSVWQLLLVVAVVIACGIYFWRRHANLIAPLALAALVGVMPLHMIFMDSGMSERGVAPLATGQPMTHPCCQTRLETSVTPAIVRPGTQLVAVILPLLVAPYLPAVTGKYANKSPPSLL